MNGDIKEKIVSVLNAAFGIQSINVNIKDGDMPFLIPVFTRQKILPILTFGLKNMGLSNLLTDELKKSEARAIFDYTQRKSALNDIADAFKYESVAYIPLKGSYICDLYPEPWMRTSSDIDVLVHEDDLNIAIKLLEEHTYFNFMKKAQHDVSFKNKHVHLELHFSLLSAVDKLNSVLSEPWKYTYEIEDSCRYNFTNEFNIFYIVAHAAKHFIRGGGMGIRPIIDIYFLRTKTTYDEITVKQLCDKAGILGFYNTCCSLISVWFDHGKHNEISECFEDLVLSGGVFGSQHVSILLNKRHNSGNDYFKHRIFMSSDDIKYHYPQCRKYPFLIPCYQVVRWTHLLKKDKTKQYLSEIKQANSIDQSEVEKYDCLLKSMGL